MKQIFIQKHNAPRLLLFFAGWGMDETPFAACTPPGYDVMICYDYRSLYFDPHLLEGYSSIRLVAWSMGVWVASQVLHTQLLPFEARIAINGTIYPIDVKRGIPPAVFQLTLRSMSQAALSKFYRNMCGTSSTYAQFTACAPQRSWQELKEELQCIADNYQASTPTDFQWDEAVIGTRDRIFAPENQQNAWLPSTLICTVEAPHYSESLFIPYLTSL